MLKVASVAFTHSVKLIPALIVTTAAKFCDLVDGMVLADAMVAMRRDRKVAWSIFIVVVIIGMCSPTYFRRSYLY